MTKVIIISREYPLTTQTDLCNMWSHVLSDLCCWELRNPKNFIQFFYPEVDRGTLFCHLELHDGYNVI